MTRDEAISAIKSNYHGLALNLTDADLQEIAESDISIYVALGMLKLDEPKNRMTVFCEEMNWPEGGMSYQILFGALDKAGPSDRREIAW